MIHGLRMVFNVNARLGVLQLIAKSVRVLQPNEHRPGQDLNSPTIFPAGVRRQRVASIKRMEAEFEEY